MEKMPPSSNTNPPPCRLCGAPFEQMLCNGLGFYDEDVPYGHADFNKVYRCPNNPIEQDMERRQRLRQISNLHAFADKRFENFYVADGGETSSLEDSLKHSLETCQQFALDPHGWIVLEGSYGSGKTHLAAAIGNARLDHGDIVLFMTAPDLLDHLRSTFGNHAEESYDTLFDRIRTTNLLILDDLGVENPSGWALEKLFQLLNHRYVEKLPTVITTNVEVDALNPRLRSRMMDTDLVRRVRITAPDYRTSQPLQATMISDLSLYSQYRFELFDTQRGCRPDEAQNLHRALTVAHAFAHRKQGWLILLGASGTGKTHLAAAIGNQCEHDGVPVMFVNVADLLDYLRQTFSPNASASFDDRFQQVKDAPLLILDDLGGVDHSKAWVKEKLLQIMKHRHVRNLPTVITTTQELESLDSQIRTRLKDRRVCLIFSLTARPFVDRDHLSK